MDTPHRFHPDGDGFRCFQLSGNHCLIRLIGVAGRFVSSSIRERWGIDIVAAAKQSAPLIEP
jgi:hypothetical protein